MGFDIAFLYAMKGFPTLAYDASKAAMDSLADRREQTIERLQKRKRIADGEIDNLRTLLVPADGVAALAQANLVTEAVSGNPGQTSGLQVSRRRRFRRPADDQHIVGHPRDTIERGHVDSKKFSLTHFFNPVLYTQDGRNCHR